MTKSFEKHSHDTFKSKKSNKKNCVIVQERTADRNLRRHTRYAQTSPEKKQLCLSHVRDRNNLFGILSSIYNVIGIGMDESSIQIYNPRIGEFKFIDIKYNPLVQEYIL
ncbi:hypothetical protein H5410_023038, partial [Solanum commersonii]